MAIPVGCSFGTQRQEALLIGTSWLVTRLDLCDDLASNRCKRATNHKIYRKSQIDNKGGSRFESRHPPLQTPKSS